MPASLFHDLESKGFLHLQNFFSFKEIEELKLDFRTSQTSVANALVKTKSVPQSSLHFLQECLSPLFEYVKKETTLKVDTWLDGCYFEEEKFSYWHQDYISYYKYQNHFDYLNFWIPIVKESESVSNVSLLPQDLLLEKFPEVALRRKGKGASEFIIQDEITFLIENDGAEENKSFYLGDVSQLAVTPKVQLGDVLILRGDIFHRTQEEFKPRVTISLRASHGQSPVSYQKFMDSSEVKKKYFQQNQADYQKIVSAFQKSGKDTLQIQEIASALTSA